MMLVLLSYWTWRIEVLFSGKIHSRGSNTFKFESKAALLTSWFLLKTIAKEIFSYDIKSRWNISGFSDLSCWTIISGNWDLKTKVPQQCKVSRMKLPSYFMEWINLKDVYLNFYKRRVSSHYFFISLRKRVTCLLLMICDMELEDEWFNQNMAVI